MNINREIGMLDQRHQTINDGELMVKQHSLVQQFDVSVDDLQCDELIVLRFDGDRKVQAGISFVHDLLVRPFDEGGHFGLSTEDQVDQFLCDLLLGFEVVVSRVPFLQPQLPLTTEQQHEVDHVFDLPLSLCYSLAGQLPYSVFSSVVGWCYVWHWCNTPNGLESSWF